MDNNKFYKTQNLFSFKPDLKNFKLNFYTWNYSPSLNVDLSLSSLHKIIVPNNINIYYRNPRIGHLYLIQIELSENVTTINHYGTNGVIIRASDYIRDFITTLLDRTGQKAIYIVFLCTTGDGIEHNKIYLDVIVGTHNLSQELWTPPS